MSREEFMRRLRGNMRGFPESEISRVLEYYYEYWNEARDAGRTDEEIVASLDTPEAIAKHVRANLAFVAMDENPGVKSFWKVVSVVLISIFALPFALPLFIVLFALAVSVVAILFSIGAVVFAMLITGGALVVAGLYCLIGGGLIVGLGMLGGGAIIAGFMLLCMVGFIASMRAVFGLIGNFFRWIYMKVTGKDNKITYGETCS